MPVDDLAPNVTRSLTAMILCIFLPSASENFKNCYVFLSMNDIECKYLLTHCGLVTPYGNRSVSTLVQVMAWCLTAPCHYLNQCWLLTGEVLWYSPKTKFSVTAQNTILYNEFEIHNLNITAISSRGQWVKWFLNKLNMWQVMIINFLISTCQHIFKTTTDLSLQ